MKPIASASMLKVALLGGVAIGSLLSGAFQASAEVGVTAAVNVDARGRPPGGAPRVLALGANIVHNEQVTTDGQGLVQILLLDGTTFTVGPNSNLTIDEFVYNPETGDAKVVASLTKGVFRFVGARTSQTEGGATVKTPVGTIGIRGGVANFSYDPATGESKAALVAGKNLTITDGDGTQRIVYETGYTAVITKDQGGGTTTSVRKSTKEETGLIQQQLSSKPGQNGGNTGAPPSDEQAEQVAETNSGLPQTMDVPGSTKPVQSSEPDQVEETAGIDGKTQDDLDNDIENETPTGNTRLLTAPDVYEAFFGGSFANAGSRGLVGTLGHDRLLQLEVEGNRLVSTDGSLNLPDYSGTEGDGPVDPYYELESRFVCGECTEDWASLDDDVLEGVAYAGRGDFVAYLLGLNDGQNFPAEQPVYVIYGTPAPADALFDLETGSDVRRYTLTEDPIQGRPVPFFNNDLYGSGFESGSYSSSDLFVIEPGNSSTGETHTFQSWISIEGTGADQRSAAFLNTSNVYRNDDGDLVMTGGRRGSFRDIVTGEATNMRGGISTIAGAGGGHFFGANADHFVIGTDASINRPDTFFDSHNGPGFSNPDAVGYLEDGNFATHHVASLVGEEPTSTYTRVNGGLDGLLSGFMAGMGESSIGGSDDPYRLSSGANSPNLALSFNPVDSAFAAQGTVHDASNDDSVVKNMLLTFGSSGATFGQSAYVDDTYYGAMDNESPTNNQLVNDSNQPLSQTPGQGAGNYIVSGRANPISGYQHLPEEQCSDCDFIQWGWWGTRLSTGPENESRQDYVHMGTWVAGEISTEDEIEQVAGLPTFAGNVSYGGTVIANVAINNANYIATGDLAVRYNFGSRTGTVDITNFDSSAAIPTGISLSSGIGGVEGNPSNSGLFSGALSGYNLYTAGDTGDLLSGNFSGAFVNSSNTPPNGGPNVAAGVIGNLDFVGTGVSAVGTAAGVRDALSPP